MIALEQNDGVEEQGSALNVPDTDLDKALKPERSFENKMCTAYSICKPRRYLRDLPQTYVNNSKFTLASGLSCGHNS